MKKFNIGYIFDSALADIGDDFNLPVEKTIQVNVKRDGVELSLSLTEDEAMALMKKIAKNLDPKKVYKAIGDIVVKD